MKVIISTRAVYPFHGYGGMEKYFYYFSKYLVKEGIDVEIVTSYDGSGKKTAESNGVKYTFIPPNFNKKPLMTIWSRFFESNVKKHLIKSDFDILHGIGGTYPYVLLKNRKPVIKQEFGYEVFRTTGITKIYNYALNYRRIKSAFKHADAVALEGEFQIEDIVRLFEIDRKKIFILPVGVDISLINGLLTTKKMSREDLGLKDTDFVLISVNRLEPEKGINYLMDAFNLIKKELGKAKLIIIGSGSEEAAIKNQIENYKLANDVINLKNVSEDMLYNYYALSDVYVSPILQDDFVMGIQEAMVCGLPIVSTGQEFLVKSGVNGYIVPQRNPKAIADAVLKIYDKNVIKAMGNKSKEIIKDYDWRNIAKIAIKKYEELLR